MARIAEISGGKSFDVTESGELGSIYEDLGSQLATRPEKREITAGFAAGGLVLLLDGLRAVAPERRETAMKGDREMSDNRRLWSGQHHRRATHDWAAPPRRPAEPRAHAEPEPAARAAPGAAGAAAAHGHRRARWPAHSWLRAESRSAT